MANNKVILASGEVLMDLTQDDVTEADVLSGKKFHLPSGENGVGSCSYDANTSDATAVASEILLSKTAYKNGSKITGTMPNNGAVSGSIATKDGQYTVPIGFHDGSGKVGIDSTEKAKIIASNIKAGVSILGITGTYSGEAISAHSKNDTPTFSQQTILPGDGYDYLSQVVIAGISVQYADNPQGGKTVTIGSV